MSMADAAPWLRDRIGEENISLTPAIEDLLANRL